MAKDFAQFALDPSPYCQSCSQDYLCLARSTGRGCREGGPPHPSLLHPTHPDWLPRITQLNGLDLDTIQSVGQTIPLLPRYIPRIRLNAEHPQARRVAALALSLREVRALAARMRETNLSAKALLGLPQQGMLVVLGFENDGFLEKAWSIPRRRQLLAAIKDVAPDFAVAWSYSVWHRHAQGWDYPRIEQVYNIKRSLVIFQNLQSLGIPAIPHVYWGDRSDLDRWIAWLTYNPSVSTIAVDLQTADSDDVWRTALRDLSYLRQSLHRPPRVFINGPCVLDRLQELEFVWPGCSVSNFGAYFSSIYHRKPMYGLKASWTRFPALSRWVVFELATMEFTRFLVDKQIRRGYGVLRKTADMVRGQVRFSANTSKVRSLEGPLQLELPLGGPIQLELPLTVPAREGAA